MKLSVPLAILALAAAACDGDNTSPVAIDSSDSADDPNAGVATQPAGNTATQPAGNTATQPAGNTATQVAPNSNQSGPSSGGAGGEVDCATVCGHIVTMACLEPAECTALCPVFEVTGTCQSLAEALARCAMAASSCDALDACETQADALDACVDGGTVEPPPTTTTPTISDTANCYTSNVCAGCTSTCDTCVCGYLYLDSSSAEIATNCGTICSSSG